MSHPVHVDALLLCILPSILPSPHDGLLRVFGLIESFVSEYPRHVGVEVPQFGGQFHGELRVEGHQGDFEVVELRSEGAVQQRYLKKCNILNVFPIGFRDISDSVTMYLI